MSSFDDCIFVDFGISIRHITPNFTSLPTLDNASISDSSCVDPGCVRPASLPLDSAPSVNECDDSLLTARSLYFPSLFSSQNPWNRILDPHSRLLTTCGLFTSIVTASQKLCQLPLVFFSHTTLKISPYLLSSSSIVTKLQNTHSFSMILFTTHVLSLSMNYNVQS